MRRTISLYLGGVRADVDTDGLVLMNYALSDIYNPTIVRNSWSQEVTLPGTPTNNRIFGESFRADRVAGASGEGVGFNASKRLSMSVYTEAGEMLVSGYAKLTGVTGGPVPSYKVTLYGGLGDMLYLLSYDSDGNKRTLASLDYTGGGDTEFDFAITASAVTDAWARLAGDTSKPAMWDCINFAPCYNGIPDKDFSADKALAVPSDLGLSVPTGMNTKGGYTLVSLPDKVDEWAAKDLRSYLQRPVLAVWKMLQAIATDAAANGWTLDLSDIDTDAEWPYRDMWLTRPLLPQLGGFKAIPGTIAALGTHSGTMLEGYGISGIASGAAATARIAFDISFSKTGGPAANLTSWRADGVTNVLEQVLFIQAVAYDSNNAVCGYSPVKAVYYGTDRVPVADIVSRTGYTPEGTPAYEAVEDSGRIYTHSAGVYTRDESLAVEVTGVGADRVALIVNAYTFEWVISTGHIIAASSALTPYEYLFNGGTDVALDGAGVTTISASVAANSGTSLRSGALITKQMLLSTEGTPADYLLAICKSFGLYLLADTAAKRVSVLRRGSFYQNTQTDLSPRVDLSHTPEIVPLAFDTKWYDFKHPSVGGRFEKEYQDTEGLQYGIQRVDTGYDFDANAKDLLSGVVLKSCAAVVDRSRYWNYIEQSSKFKPSPFLDAGCKYTLWDGGGESQEQEISQPSSSATITYYNTTFPGCDLYSRPEFRNGENKGVEGADVLLAYNFDANYKHFRVTDDVSEMDTINGGPCWLFAPDAVGLDIPQFTRYWWSGQAIERMLDFGYPRQVDIPGAEFYGPSLYEGAWQLYIRDRLSVHNKVLKCRVDFSGLKVGPELFRRFWWWRGSLWVLNKISNYSLTTYDPAECEFIQVRDTSNYLNGQY